MKLSWLKLSVDILDDHKIKKIRKLPGGNEILICWLAILCMAMKSHRPGLLFISEDLQAGPDDIAVAAEVSNEIAEIAIKTFVKLGMITVDDAGTIEVSNFKKHQDLERIAYKQALANERKRRFRERMNDQTKLIGTHVERVPDASRTPIESEIEREIEIESEIETEIKKKKKTKTKNAPAVAGAIADLKPFYDPFWLEAKELGLIPEEESQRMFFSLMNILRKHKREHVADGFKFAMRWLRYCLRKKRVPPGHDERRKWVIGEIKYSFDYIRDRGLEATESLAKFAINEDFWSGALFSLKNLYKAESKREAMIENDK